MDAISTIDRGWYNFEARYSRRKLRRFLEASILFTILTAIMAFGLVPIRKDQSFIQFVGYCGFLFFGSGVFVILWRLVAVRDPVLTVTPEGIRDSRVAAKIIPWRVIRKVSTWEYRSRKGRSGARGIVLDVDEADEDQLALTRYTRLMRPLSRGLGVDGLFINPAALDVEYDRLFQAITDYVEGAHKV